LVAAAVRRFPDRTATAVDDVLGLEGDLRRPNVIDQPDIEAIVVGRHDLGADLNSSVIWPERVTNQTGTL
jgi:hypothetical protein